jgi:hypothetical protein
MHLCVSCCILVTVGCVSCVGCVGCDVAGMGRTAVETFEGYKTEVVAALGMRGDYLRCCSVRTGHRGALTFLPW